MKKFLRWIKLIIIIYCLAGIGVYFFQDKLLFKPEALPQEHNYRFSQPYRDVNIPYDAQSNLNIIQFLPAGTPAKGVVIYFHGNRQNVARYAKFAPFFTKHGYEVWMPDYPGYGKSTGEFTEQRLYDWALTTYKLARSRFAPDSIVLYGKSLGSGIATQLASIRDCKYLLLETPYYSIPSIPAQYAPIYPYGRMIRFKIPTHQYLQQVTAPVAVFHGTSDGVITYRNAKRLMPFLKKKDRFITIPGGSHNDLADFPQYAAAMDSLFN